jgi:hypothetical protein
MGLASDGDRVDARPHHGVKQPDLTLERDLLRPKHILRW